MKLNKLFFIQLVLMGALSFSLSAEENYEEEQAASEENPAETSYQYKDYDNQEEDGQRFPSSEEDESDAPDNSRSRERYEYYKNEIDKL